MHLHTHMCGRSRWLGRTLNLGTMWKSRKRGFLCYPVNSSTPLTPPTYPASLISSHTRKVEHAHTLMTHTHKSESRELKSTWHMRSYVCAVALHSPFFIPASLFLWLSSPLMLQGGWQARWGLLSPGGLSGDTKRGLRATGSNDS